MSCPGIRALRALARDLAFSAITIIGVPPVAIALGILAAFENHLPQPAGRGPLRRDEYR